jgi:hypothetical protein
MKLLELVFLYVCVGAGCALFVLARRGAAHGVDAALLIPLWPVLAPSLLAERPFARSPALLLDEHAAQALDRGMRAARSRIAEIDRALARPEFSLDAALLHHADLETRGRVELADTAMRRVQNIRRLRTLRERFAAELEQVAELLEQLEVQAEVVRLAGAPDAGVRDLVRELMDHVEGLDAALALEAAP